MKRPKDYSLGINSRVNACTTDDEGDRRRIFLCTHYTEELLPRSARALGKRLIAMADWTEAK